MRIHNLRRTTAAFSSEKAYQSKVVSERLGHAHTVGTGVDDQHSQSLPKPSARI
jgi:integrase